MLDPSDIRHGRGSPNGIPSDGFLASRIVVKAFIMALFWHSISEIASVIVSMRFCKLWISLDKWAAFLAMGVIPLMVFLAFMSSLLSFSLYLLEREAGIRGGSPHIKPRGVIPYLLGVVVVTV